MLIELVRSQCCAANKKFVGYSCLVKNSHCKTVTRKSAQFIELLSKTTLTTLGQSLPERLRIEAVHFLNDTQSECLLVKDGDPSNKLEAKTFCDEILNFVLHSLP